MISIICFLIYMLLVALYTLFCVNEEIKSSKKEVWDNTYANLEGEGDNK